MKLWRALAIGFGLCAATPQTSHALESLSGVRGITVGPIENAYHPGLGYGSAACQRTLDESSAMGANWVALTPFGRVGDLNGLGVDSTFEALPSVNEANIRRAIRDAHARGLKVFLVPHLWTESHEWRALINPKTEAGWKAWAASYGRYVLRWANVAEEEHVEMIAAGVELRSWVTTTHAPLFSALLKDVRKTYHGLLTYSANWDDVDDTVILGELDVIGINAFFPLAEKPGASLATLREGGARVRDKVQRLSRDWQKPVVFTEIGYTTIKDPAVTPWIWPEDMKHVELSQLGQARAYHGLLAALLAEPESAPGFAGFFVWRTYADPDDVSQEPEFGFSPRGKLAELVMRDAFAARWPSYSITHPWGTHAVHSGLYSPVLWR